MRRLQPEKAGTPTYRQIWRVVDGAVATALAAHPDFVAPGKRLSTVRNSIVKRVTGAITGYAEQSAWVRSGSSPADEVSKSVVETDFGEDGRQHPFTAITPHDRRAGGAWKDPLPFFWAAAVIPAPTGPATPDLTGLTIRFAGALAAFGGPVALLWLARLNGWV